MSGPARIIYNCHVHTFTINHVPRFVGLRIVSWLMRPNILRRLVIPFIRRASRFRRLRRWARYADFLAITADKDQEQVFNELQARYPGKTRFVVLPMDLAHMKTGAPLEAPRNLDDQHMELEALRVKYPEEVIPFFGVDPRRPGILEKLKEAIEHRGFRGIKIYPNLGFTPTHPNMDAIWEYANRRKLPVMTHCSRGGMHGYDEIAKTHVTEDTAERYGAPYLYIPILEKYPDLRLCLAHLGGQKEWDNFLLNPWFVGAPNKPKSWLAQILEMLPLYPNLYTDISYTIFYFQDFVPALKVFLVNDLVRQRVLYGSDYYMADLEEYSERLLSINLRAALGEDLFWQIANTNPEVFLAPPRLP